MEFMVISASIIGTFIILKYIQMPVLKKAPAREKFKKQ
jgi:hypothetical protein